jgi:hypothetical protein
MLAFLMKMIVFVPSTHPGIPCASLPNSFPHERSHVSLVLGFAMRCLYSIMLLSSPITAFAISAIQLIPVLTRWLLLGVSLAIIATSTDQLLISNAVFALALASGLYCGRSLLPSLSLSWDMYQGVGLLGAAYASLVFAFCTLGATAFSLAVV